MYLNCPEYINAFNDLIVELTRLHGIKCEGCDLIEQLLVMLPKLSYYIVNKLFIDDRPDNTCFPVNDVKDDIMEFFEYLDETIYDGIVGINDDVIKLEMDDLITLQELHLLLQRELYNIKAEMMYIKHIPNKTIKDLIRKYISADTFKSMLDKSEYSLYDSLPYNILELGYHNLF